MIKTHIESSRTFLAHVQIEMAAKQDIESEKSEMSHESESISGEIVGKLVEMEEAKEEKAGDEKGGDSDDKLNESAEIITYEFTMPEKKEEEDMFAHVPDRRKRKRLSEKVEQVGRDGDSGWTRDSAKVGLGDSDVQELPPKKIKKEHDLDPDAVKVIETKTQSITLLTCSMKS